MIRGAVFGVALLMLATPGAFAEAAPRGCQTPESLLDLGTKLPRVAERIARREPVTIVAIGSSSTAGAGASNPGAAYPARLAAYWPSLFPDSPVRVINRGIGGEEVKQMMARFERDIQPAGANLILWQLGVNAVLRRNGISDHKALIAQGIAMLKAKGTDVVLIDMQYAPKVLADPDHPAMELMLKETTRDAGVGLFRRFAIMRHWQESGQIPQSAMITGDGLHMTDRSYDCWAGALAVALARAVKPPAMIGASPPGPLAR